MKSTIELQQEVRAIEEEMRKLSARLGQLSGQLSEEKSAEELSRETLSALDALAEEFPVKNPTIEKLLPSQKETYFRLLSTAAALSGDSIDKLLYLCRLSVGSACEFRALPLQKMAYQTDKLDWRAAAVDLKECGNILLLDMMTVAGINGAVNDAAIDFLGELAALLEVAENELRVISQLASAVLSKDCSRLDAVEADRPYPEMNYILPKGCILSSSHQYAGRTFYSVENITINGNRCVPDHGFVKKGEKIIYFSSPAPVDRLKELKIQMPAPILADCTGTVQFQQIEKEPVFSSTAKTSSGGVGLLNRLLKECFRMEFDVWRIKIINPFAPAEYYEIGEEHARHHEPDLSDLNPD